MIESHEIRQLLTLEREMWRTETRCDPQFQERHFATDFVEFGRSGRVYSRSQVMFEEAFPINAELSNFELRELGPGSVLITYDSARVTNGETVEFAHRSSIWTKTNKNWQMRFHQGTPFESSIT